MDTSDKLIDGVIREAQILVEEAKSLELNNELINAKHKYLDAATVFLNHSSTKQGQDKIVFQNLAKMLVDQAKELQIEINLAKSPLPMPPGKNAPVKPIVESIPPVYQIIIIHPGGVPIYTHTFGTVSQDVKDKLNEILFSGAITAINQLMTEIIQVPIQKISFERGVLLFREFKGVIAVIHAEKSNSQLHIKFNEFLTEFRNSLEKEFEEAISKGKDLSNQPIAFQLIKKHFTYKLK
ncbi:MAG: hypothetical protein OEZ01_08665 [Candidatus Heimdallarchaeota archaeon]|nr:hypothetical protein [Candidatus Heimdallarchaeota archaeon]MDH5646066.1 hypothetical protein [Candidatus Heimdallarchaeota archaeon]